MIWIVLSILFAVSIVVAICAASFRYRYKKSEQQKRQQLLAQNASKNSIYSLSSADIERIRLLSTQYAIKMDALTATKAIIRASTRTGGNR